MKIKQIINEENLKKVVDTTVKGIANVLPYVIMFSSTKASSVLLDKIRYSGNITYNDVVEAIMDSRMWSSDKIEAIAILPKNLDSDLYKAVIRITKSTMFSEDKLEAIKQISFTTEKESV